MLSQFLFLWLTSASLIFAKPFDSSAGVEEKAASPTVAPPTFNELIEGTIQQAKLFDGGRAKRDLRGQSSLVKRAAELFDQVENFNRYAAPVWNGISDTKTVASNGPTDDLLASEIATKEDPEVPFLKDPSNQTPVELGLPDVRTQTVGAPNKFEEEADYEWRKPHYKQNDQTLELISLKTNPSFSVNLNADRNTFMRTMHALFYSLLGFANSRNFYFNQLEQASIPMCPRCVMNDDPDDPSRQSATRAKRENAAEDVGNPIASPDQVASSLGTATSTLHDQPTPNNQSKSTNQQTSKSEELLVKAVELEEGIQPVLDPLDEQKIAHPYAVTDVNTSSLATTNGTENLYLLDNNPSEQPKSTNIAGNSSSNLLAPQTRTNDETNSDLKNLFHHKLLKHVQNRLGEKYIPVDQIRNVPYDVELPDTKSEDVKKEERPAVETRNAKAPSLTPVGEESQPKASGQAGLKNNDKKSDASTQTKEMGSKLTDSFSPIREDQYEKTDWDDLDMGTLVENNYPRKERQMSEEQTDERTNFYLATSFGSRNSPNVFLTFFLSLMLICFKVLMTSAHITSALAGDLLRST